MDAPGTAHRNHCPSCLWSKHLDDDVPGDRDAECGSSMEPIAITVRGDGEWVLIHRCLGCDEVHRTDRPATTTRFCSCGSPSGRSGTPPSPPGSSARSDEGPQPPPPPEPRGGGGGGEA